MAGTAIIIAAVLANTGIAVADFAHAPFVLANSSEVGVPRRWIPVLGTLKLAGASGLVVGLAGVDAVGVAASVGLTAFFVGAVVTHVRARVFHNVGFPLVFLFLAAGALAANLQT